jgi:hypothetical protein
MNGFVRTMKRLGMHLPSFLASRWTSTMRKESVGVGKSRIAFLGTKLVWDLGWWVGGSIGAGAPESRESASPVRNDVPARIR